MQAKINPDFTVLVNGEGCREVLDREGNIYVFTNEDEDVLCVALDHSQPKETSLMVILQPLGSALDTCKITVSSEDYQKAERQLNAWLDTFYGEE